MTKLQVIEQAGNRIRNLQDDIAKLQAQIDTKNRVIKNLSNNQKNASEMELMKARDEGRRIVEEANSYYQRKKAEADDVLAKAKTDAQEIINSNTQVVRSDIRKLENTRGHEKQRAVQFLRHLLGKGLSLRCQINQPWPMSYARCKVRIRPVDRFCLHHHSGSAAIRIVIDTSVSAC